MGLYPYDPTQVSSVQNFQVHVTDPAYTGLPVWVYADFSSPLKIHYPYGEDPGDIREDAVG